MFIPFIFSFKITLQMRRNESQQKCLKHLYLISHIAIYWPILLVINISGNGNNCSLNKKGKINHISVCDGSVESIRSYFYLIIRSKLPCGRFAPFHNFEISFHKIFVTSNTIVQFHWQYFITNSSFWLVSILG